MRFTKPTAVAAMLMLAACGKHGDSVSMTNASVDEVAKTQKAKIQPGEWEVTMEMVSQETKGGPAGMPTPPKMPPMTTKACITPEQVNKPEGMFSGGMEQMKKNCTYDHFTMSDGRIDAKMHCDMGQGMKLVSATTGTFSGTEITSDSNSTVSGLPGGMSTTSHAKMTAKRVGECTTPPAQAATVGNKAG